MIGIDLDLAGADEIIKDLGATPKQCAVALRSTMRQLAGWIRTQSARGLSRELELPMKIIRRRLRTMRVRQSADGASVTLWYGLNPIGLMHLGARQTRAGVTAGTRKRSGAFIATGRSGTKEVFKRSGKARLPLERQVVEIQDPAQMYLEDALLGGEGFTTRFFTLFERELKWRTGTVNNG